jgi:5S rRNA maturation endonuclease (ribonuclease M5)
MNYMGRTIDPISLWEQYVEFPTSYRPERNEIFTPKLVCPNPGHDTSKRHFQINVREGLVHCFAHCGISGTFTHAICTIHGFYDEFQVDAAQDDRERNRRRRKAHRKAERIIYRYKGRASRAGKEIRRKHEKPKAPEIDLSYEMFVPKAGLDYLGEREITAQSIAQWEIGWDMEDKRLVIPARDEHGQLKLLIRRVLDHREPKYLYSEGVSKTSLLFGACYLSMDQVESEGLILVEGSLDTIRLHQNGFRNAVGILGTGISQQQRNILSRYRPRRVYLMFDKDVSGVRNIEIASQALRKYPMYVVRYPKHRSDPAEMGKEEVVRALERAVPFMKFKSPNVKRSNLG